MTYIGFKDLRTRTASGKVLRDEAFNIVKSPKYDGYQRRLLQWFTNFVIKSLVVLLIVLLKVKLYQTNDSQIN